MVTVLALMADPSPVRVAVISDADNHDLAALVTTELSSNPAIALVERDALAKIGDELKVQQLADSDAIALGKLVGADGLLFINKGTTGLQLRFTAVDLGYALVDDQVAANTDLPQLAKSIAHRMTSYAPKLKLDPGKVVPISVLNLRADYATADATSLERNLTLLLENRLASLPDYVVLERRHAWSLGFEHSLVTPPKPLLQGAYVVDGTFGLPAQVTGNLALHLRLRSPDGHQTETTIQGAPVEMAALVEKLIVEIRKTTGNNTSPPEWQPSNEAHEYLMEGIWGWQHKANHEALEALDSAELLGEKSSALLAVRARVLCALATEGVRFLPEVIPLADWPSTPSLAVRTEAMVRAIQDAVQFQKEKANPLLPASPPEVQSAVRYADPVNTTISLATNLLALLDRDSPTLSEQVREALRPLTLYDPLHGTLGPFYAQGHVTGRDLSANEWPKTLDEQLASYRVMCSDEKQWMPENFRKQGKDFCVRFLKTPEEQAAGFDRFVDSLKDIPGARLHYLLIRTTSADATQADNAYKAYLEEAWKRRDEFAQAEGYPAQWAEARYVPNAVLVRNASSGVPLLHYALQHRDSFTGNDPAIDFLWQPEGWSETDARALWPEFQVYKERVAASYKTKNKNVDYIISDLKKYEDSFLKKFPNLALPDPVPILAADPVFVTRFWSPPMTATESKNDFTFAGMDGDAGGLWIAGFKSVEHPALFRVSLPDLTTKVIDIPEGLFVQGLRVASDAVYLLCLRHPVKDADPIVHQIARYDLKSLSWTLHTLPEYTYGNLYCLENVVYLFLKIKVPGNDELIARYDCNQDKLTILSSTRRRPAQNQFDDRTGYWNAALYLGPDHKPCVTTEDGTYYIQENPGQWPEVYAGTWLESSITVLGKTIVVDKRGEIIFLSPDQIVPEYWTASPIPIVRKRALPKTEPVKEIAPWASQTLWDLPADADVFIGKVAYTDNRLFILNRPTVKGGDYNLLCYEKGKGRNPQQIPLRFRLEDATRAALVPKPDDPAGIAKLNLIERPEATVYGDGSTSYYAMKQGLCLRPRSGGFWFLPYSDLEAYLKAYPKSSATSPSQPSNKE